MRNRKSIYLLTIGLILVLGGAAYAQDHAKTVSTEQAFQKDIYLAQAPIVTMDVVSVNEINYLVLSNHGETRIVKAVPEVRDQSYRSSADYDSDYNQIPTPRLKQVKTVRLIRLILKHPKGSI